MRASSSLRPLLAGLQSVKSAATGTPLVSAWLQHLLHLSSASMHSSSSSSTSTSSSSSSSVAQQIEQLQKLRGAEELQEQQGGADTAPYVFSIRPSVLSPLHPYHRELQDEKQRLHFLKFTLMAQVKLAEEITPKELEQHQGSPDPVAAALSARRAALQTVRDSYSSLLKHHMHTETTVDNMGGYYAILESLLKFKDRDMKKFQEVVEGKEDVWRYWLEHFSQQYAGLPSLGRLEDIYKQHDEEAMSRKLRELAVKVERPPREPQVDHLGRAAAVGGRKTSVARVFLWRGQGRVLVNRKPLDAYFSDLLMRSHVLKPLMTTGLVDQLDVLVHVQGGGISGQAQAAAHGIARALVRLDPSLKPTLKSAKLLRRDPRAVERKKFGKAKARKGFAWVKR